LELLERLEISEVLIRDLEYSGRLDSEYYKPSYVNYETLLKNRGSKPLKEFANFLIGPFGSAFTVDNYTQDKTYRYIRGKDVKALTLMNNDNVYMPKKDYDRLSRYALKENDVLVSVVASIGNAAIINSVDLPAIFSCKSAVIRTDNINPKYLLAYLNCKFGKELLIRKERGAIQKGLNLDDLKTLDIFIPSLNFQSNIESLFNKSYFNKNQSQELYSQAETILLQEIGLEESIIEQLSSKQAVEGSNPSAFTA
jgi:hypothetical protein